MKERVLHGYWSYGESTNGILEYRRRNGSESELSERTVRDTGEEDQVYRSRLWGWTLYNQMRLRHEDLSKRCLRIIEEIIIIIESSRSKSRSRKYRESSSRSRSRG